MGSRVAVEQSRLSMEIAVVVGATGQNSRGGVARRQSRSGSHVGSARRGSRASGSGDEPQKVINLHLKGTPAKARSSTADKGADTSRAASKIVVDSPVAPGELSSRDREDLVVKYRLKARKLSRSILRKWHSRLDLQEVDSIVDLSLCEAVRRYDPTKGASFMTFLYFHLRGNLIRAVAGAVQAQAIPSFEDDAAVWADELDDNSNSGPSIIEVTEALYSAERVRPDELILKRELSRISAQAFESLDPLEREVIDQIFFKERQLLDIARTLGYSRCHVSRVKKRALQVLHRVLRESLGKEAPEGPGPLFDSEDEASQMSIKNVRRRRPRSGSRVELERATARKAA